MPEGIVTKTWAHPRSVRDFACQWRAEVVAARKLGARVGPRRYHELRYESLVADPEGELQGICDFAGLEYEPGMLDYAGKVDVSAKPHQQSLTRPPTPGLRDWRTQLSPEDAAAFDAAAGDLLRELGYESSGSPTAGGRISRAWYAARVSAWNASGSLVRRSSLWRRRHPPLS
jgi:hypothetical protein